MAHTISGTEDVPVVARVDMNGVVVDEPTTGDAASRTVLVVGPGTADVVVAAEVVVVPAIVVVVVVVEVVVVAAGTKVNETVAGGPVSGAVA